jgi:glycosyltransferase involved in cell wall biosynthesis
VTGLRHYADGPDCEEAEGLTFTAPAAGEGPAGLREWREIGAFAKSIEDVCRQWRPDVLHAHSPALCGMAGLRVARKLGIPLVYEIRAFWEDAAVGNGTGRQGDIKYMLTRTLENHVVSGADAVVTICQGLKDDLIARGNDPAQITIMPNGVDLALFGNPTQREPALAEELGLGDGPVIGFIGSFYDYEGIDDLIDAMPGLIAVHPDARLLLVGGGPMDRRCGNGRRVERSPCDSLYGPRAPFPGRALLCALRHHGLSAQKEPPDRSGHAVKALGSHGAG